MATPYNIIDIAPDFLKRWREELTMTCRFSDGSELRITRHEMMQKFIDFIRSGGTPQTFNFYNEYDLPNNIQISFP